MDAARHRRREAITLLRTKLHMPRVSGDVIERSTLYNRLNRGLSRKLILISAPAGFGKTTLVCAWLQDNLRPIAWLSLGENDNDLRVFLSYVVAAIRTIFPEACSQTHGLLKAPQIPPLDYLATTLSNEITELPEPPSSKDFILVLDDYHRIHDKTVHQFIDKLLAYLPFKMHLVLISRIDPPFAIASLQVQQQMTEIRTAELRFSLDETQTYLEQVLGESLPREIVTVLVERTEGWIAGLRLAALSMRGQKDYTTFVKGFKGVSREVATYLTEEVLAHQSQLTQDFLLQTSLLDRFCAPLCAAVTGKPGNSCQNILESLERDNIFVVPLDHEQGWYRYHHLFQELLHKNLQSQLSDDEIAALHNKASVWLGDNGFIEEALHHALAAGDLESAAQLVEDVRHDLLNREDRVTLERCLNRLPEQVVRERPALLVTRAWVLELQYQIARIPPLLQEAEARLKATAADSEPELRGLRGEIDALWSFVLYLGNEGQRSLDSALRAVERIPVANAFVHSFAVLFLALAYQITGQMKTALRTLNESLAEIGTQSDTIIARMLIGQIYVYMLAGNLHQAEQILHQLEQVASKTRLTISLVVVHWVLGRLNYEWNNLETASQHFTAVFELRYGGQFIMVYDSMMTLALIYQTQGMKEKREETLAALRRFALEIGNTKRFRQIDSFEARLALLQGNLQQATRWLEIVHSEISTGTGFYLECPVVTEAKVLIAQKTVDSLQEATRSLQKLLSYTRSKHNTIRQIEVLALLALAYHGQGQTDDALETLAHSLELAQPGCFIRTYVDLGSEMAGLLYQLADRGAAPDYIGRILAAFPETPTADGTALMIRKAAQAEMIEPLTERESEILMLLAQEMPNKVIARTLNISSLTVKRHTVNIYQKLNVNSRKQAVVRARALGILPSD